MTRLEFAKLIASGKDFDIKSFHFGECRLLNGVDYIVLYRDSKIPAVEIARWRKECFAKYLRYLARVFDWVKNDNDELNTSDCELKKECAMLDAIFEFINIG